MAAKPAKALRRTPTDEDREKYPNLAAAKDWDKAQRVYRSLVLQNIDTDAGITKAEVYLALGIIHAERGEAPKAKGMFQRGLEVEPEHEKLKSELAKLT